MTNREAIERLMVHKEFGFLATTNTAIDMAIEALEKQDAIDCKLPRCPVCGQAIDWGKAK